MSRRPRAAGLDGHYFLHVRPRLILAPDNVELQDLYISTSLVTASYGLYYLTVTTSLEDSSYRESVSLTCRNVIFETVTPKVTGWNIPCHLTPRRRHGVPLSTPSKAHRCLLYRI